MKRITVVITEDLAALLDAERRRRDCSVAEVIREAVSVYFGIVDRQSWRPRIAALGRSGYHDTASQAEETLAEHWRPIGSR